MADYDGFMIENWWETEKIQGSKLLMPGLMIGSIRHQMSDDRAHAGSYSMRILPGGFREFFVATDAGNRTLSVWIYSVAKNSGCRLELFDIDRHMTDYDENTTADVWEQLSIAFVATKKIYIARIVNYKKPDDDQRAYFDDLRIT